MIPATAEILKNDFQITERPTKTFKLDIERGVVFGTIDGIEAMKQAIFLILNTERFRHIIYSWNYGSEFSDLIGKPKPLVMPELKRLITEALKQDSRITDVKDFSFTSDKGKVNVTFTVVTIFGEIESETAVTI